MPSPAARKQEEIDQISRAMDRIDADPEEALNALEPSIKAAANVGELTMQDMFRLVSQLQQQQAAMATQVLQMIGNQQTQGNGLTAIGTRADLADELRRDKQQRDNTLEAWKTEPREPVYIPPNDDEAKIHKVTGHYPPRSWYVNGLEYPINVGEVVPVPSSIARQVEWSLHRRVGPIQQIDHITDPMRGQFLGNGVPSISLGSWGETGVGPLRPEMPPANPQPLGYKYDHRGN